MGLVLRLCPLGALLPMLLLAGCGGAYSPDTYDAAAVQQANKVERGILVGVRPVRVSADGTGATATGAAAGGIVGAATPWGTVSRAFSALGGAVMGGVAGSTIGHELGDTNAWEYMVREPNGDLVSVTQRDQKPLEVGLNVLVITGKQARVVPDYTIPVAPPTARATGKQSPPAPSRTARPATISATPLIAPSTAPPILVHPAAPLIAPSTASPALVRPAAPSTAPSIKPSTAPASAAASSTPTPAAPGGGATAAPAN